MLKFKLLQNNGNLENSSESHLNLLKNLYVFKTFTMADFETMLNQLESVVLAKKSKMLIVDSLASIVRREFSGTDSATLHDRAVFLTKISARLKQITQLLDVSVNQKIYL